MDQRRLGRTGHMSSVVTFGAAGIGRVQQDVADRAIAGYSGFTKVTMTSSSDWTVPSRGPWRCRESVRSAG